MGEFMEYEFKTLKELYDRIKPALTSKRKEFIRIGINYITEVDIWNYLADKKWKSASELSLSEMVSDIFLASVDEVNNHFISEAAKNKREPHFDN
ncbi:post-transcriptional regulator [Clostridium sp. CAG:1193]|nr:post-transcriptional regulator [Clostridium sp. CAG:1193]